MKFTHKLAPDGRPFYKFDFRGRRVVRPGDIHLPNQDNNALRAATIDAVGKNDNPILFLGGDTGDMEGLSKFPKDPDKIVKKNSIKKEREAWERWLERWLNVYDEIVIAPGNHERRAHNMVFSNPAFVGMGWWWPYGDLFVDNRLTVLDVGYRAELDFGTNPKIYDEHGDELRGATSKCPAAGVAEHNPGDHVIIFGHTHRAARVTHTRLKGGKKMQCTAINVGHLSDTKKNGYASDPNWQFGCAYLDEDDIDLKVW
jgi:predicted phosphodiesterase